MTWGDPLLRASCLEERLNNVAQVQASHSAFAAAKSPPLGFAFIFGIHVFFNSYNKPQEDIKHMILSKILKGEYRLSWVTDLWSPGAIPPVAAIAGRCRSSSRTCSRSLVAPVLPFSFFFFFFFGGGGFKVPL